MEQNIKHKIIDFLPWILTIAALVTSMIIGLAYQEDSNLFAAKSNKVDLLSIMRIHLLEATEAEKNAVLAITDEASNDFAAQARQTTDRVESGRKEIESIIRRDNLPLEIEKIDEFNVCWSEYQKLDKTILDLATQNTNIKAQKISATQCAQEMARIDESLTRIIQRGRPGNKDNNAVSLSYQALTASLKIFALHKSHIEEANDQEMDKIEQSIKSHDESARKALNNLHSIADLSDNVDLKNAETAYQDFMKLTGEVLRLSRMNTNIKSAELSLGRKRMISAQCQEILANLKETVQSPPHQGATR